MSATSVKAFVGDITNRDVKAVVRRLRTEKAGQRHNDSSIHGGGHYTLLHAAVRVGCAAIVSALIKAGAAVDAGDQGGATPLHWLAAFEDAEHVGVAEELLKKHKASVNARDAKGSTPLHAAAGHGNAPVVALLLKHCAAIGDAAPGHTPLHAAARRAALPAIELLLEAGAATHMQDREGFTPLMRLLQVSTSSGKADDGAARAAVALTLLSRASLDWAVGAQEPTGGRSALLLLCAWPRPDVALAAALVDRGGASVVDAQTRPDGQTALMLTLQGRHWDLALLLLQHTQQVAAASSSGVTALSLAAASAERSDAGPALLLAVLAASPPLDAQEGVALLRQALALRWDEVAAKVLHLLPTDALDAAQREAPSLLSFDELSRRGMGRAACALLARNTPGGVAALAQLDAEGRNALHRAAAANDTALVAGLLHLGVCANTTTADGDAALHIAAKHGHVEACKALVEGGADPLWRNSKNRTPGGQLKLPSAVSEYLAGVEAAQRQAKADKQKQLWDDKMRATMTDSACILRSV